jgi:hypothetical protein
VHALRPTPSSATLLTQGSLVFGSFAGHVDYFSSGAHYTGMGSDYCFWEGIQAREIQGFSSSGGGEMAGPCFRRRYQHGSISPDKSITRAGKRWQ